MTQRGFGGPRIMTDARQKQSLRELFRPKSKAEHMRFPCGTHVGLPAQADVRAGQLFAQLTGRLNSEQQNCGTKLVSVLPRIVKQNEPIADVSTQTVEPVNRRMARRR